LLEIFAMKLTHWRGGLALACWSALALGGLASADEPDKPTAPASDKNPAVPAAGHSLHGEAFSEGPRQRATLLTGQGQAVRFAVTTKSADAQKFIDQGVAQIHTFYYLEAERSFRQAALLDADCAMAYWGMAMANVNNSTRAKAFLKEAQNHAAKTKITRREQLYLDALEAQYKVGGGMKGQLAGLETIVQDFPDDLDAKAWLAMITWQTGGITSRQAVDSLLEAVERIEPLFPGVHHYRIHLWDGVKPLRAEKSAALYAKAAPGIAHAWHMPGHTYTGLKRYADAAYQQEGSARVDHAAMARDRVMPFEIHNYAHNNQWLATSLSHIGRPRDAIIVARNLVEQPRDPQKNGKNDGGSPQRSGRARWSEVLTRAELWDDLIAATESGALDWSDIAMETKERAYTLGLAYAAKEDKAKLAEQIEALRKPAASTPGPRTPRPAGAPPAASAPAPAPQPAPTPAPQAAATSPELSELEGYQKLLDGDVAAAFDLFGKASRMRGEALARAHLKARNFGFAETTAKKNVDNHPNELPPLAAYVEILQLCGKEKEALANYRKLEPMLKHADLDIPVFQRLAPVIASWKQSKDWASAPPEPETDDAKMNRIDLTTLGPLGYEPYTAEPFDKPDTTGASWSLAGHKGKNVIVLFFLGGKCPHCMQQLQTFGKELSAFEKLNTDVVAISTDDAEATKALKNNADGVKFPMPMLADPARENFRAYRAFDDFENQPLHATFLIDAQGKVRFQRISADPFLDVDFLKTEAARATRLSKS
jgi:peroxiredoxin